jgi:hypothetical protein
MGKPQSKLQEPILAHEQKIEFLTDLFSDRFEEFKSTITQNQDLMQHFYKITKYP